MVPQQGVQQPVYQQPTFQQPVVPQSGTYAAPAPAAVQPQPTAPPMLSPTPSLKPIPDLQRTPAANGRWLRSVDRANHTREHGIRGAYDAAVPSPCQRHAGSFAGSHERVWHRHEWHGWRHEHQWK